MWSLLLVLAFFEATKGQQISGYGPVDVAELNPLTLNWNQVPENWGKNPHLIQKFT